MSQNLSSKKTLNKSLKKNILIELSQMIQNIIFLIHLIICIEKKNACKFKRKTWFTMMQLIYPLLDQIFLLIILKLALLIY